MTIVVHELSTELFQTMTTGPQHEVIRAIRPHLLKFLNPAGSLYMEIEDTDSNVVATSEEIDIVDISVADYFHGYIRFFIDAVLAPDTDYNFYLRHTGYTFDEAAYIGWCNDYDLRKYELGYEADDLTAPLDQEIWGQNLVSGGTYP